MRGRTKVGQPHKKGLMSNVSTMESFCNLQQTFRTAYQCSKYLNMFHKQNKGSRKKKFFLARPLRGGPATKEKRTFFYISIYLAQKLWRKFFLSKSVSGYIKTKKNKNKKKALVAGPLKNITFFAAPLSIQYICYRKAPYFEADLFCILLKCSNRETEFFVKDYFAKFRKSLQSQSQLQTLLQFRTLQSDRLLN